MRAELEATVEALRSETNVVEIDIPFTLDDILKIYAPLLVPMFADRMPVLARNLAKTVAPVLRLGPAGSEPRPDAGRHTDWGRSHP